MDAPTADWRLAPAAPLTSFVGREREAVALADLLLRPDAHLVTLVGPGGVGKTRLTLHAVHALAAAFADGLVYVDLSPIVDPGLVASSVAQALGVREASDRPIANQLFDALRDRELLLILDNFEQVVDAAPFIAALLAAAARLTVLVTSREPLRLTAEWVVAVPPLAVPEAALPLAELAGTDAVRLFVERAQAVRADFALTAANAPLIVDVVRRLDGLPLAIELAAAQMSHLAPPSLLARLDHRLALLTSGARDLPARQRTLRATIAWSHDPLSADGRALFRRLAVFVGGCTLEAAEAVCRADGETALDVLAGLALLTAKSLIWLEQTPNGEPRYRMLETIREYALERLDADAEATAIRRAHAAYFLSLAERHEFAETFPAGDRALSPLEADYANLRAALGWLQDAGEGARFLRFVGALGQFWSGLGRYREGYDWLSRALVYSDAAPAEGAKAQVSLGMIQIHLGLPEAAEASLTAGLTGCRAHQESFQVARALLGLGGLATLGDDLQRGEALLRECLAIASTVADRRPAGMMEGWAMINLADVARARGDYVQADAHLTGALGLMRKAERIPGTIMALGDLGDVARDRGEHARALELYREALALGRERPATPVVIYVIESVGVVAVALGRAERGVRLLGATEVLRERTGLRFRVAENQVALDHAVVAARAALGDAAFAVAWVAGRGLRPAQAIAEALDPFDIVVAAPHAALTPRETDVLRLLAAGQSNKGIAVALGMSVRTAERHIANLYAKIDAAGRAEAIAFAHRHGLA